MGRLSKGLFYSSVGECLEAWRLGFAWLELKVVVWLMGRSVPVLSAIASAQLESGVELPSQFLKVDIAGSYKNINTHVK